MTAFPVLELLLETLLSFACSIIILFLPIGIMRLYGAIFYGD